MPYLGASVGGGGGWVTVDAVTNRSLGLAGEARVGVALGPRLALDAGGAILTVDESRRFPPAEPVLAVRLTHAYAAASLFPAGDALFVRAGLGYGWLSATNGFDAPSPSLGASGLAAQAGIGYRLWLNERAALRVEAQGFLHRRGGGTATARAATLALGVDLYLGVGARAR